MPQEAGAADMIERRGAGVLLRNASETVPVVRRMVEDDVYYAGMRAATAGLAFPNSTRRIVEEITALIPAQVMGREEALRAGTRTA